MNFLGKVLGKRVSDLITTPAADPFDLFTQSCSESIRMLKDPTGEHAKTLARHFSFISNSLLQGIGNRDAPCFDYFIQEGVLAKISDSFFHGLYADYCSPVLDFILSFFDTELCAEFGQVQVHGPIGSLLSKLELLDRRAPQVTRKFVLEIWKTCERNPMFMELTGQDGPNGRFYPLLNYMVNGIWFITDSQDNRVSAKTRNLIIDFFASQHKLRESYEDYVCSRLFPKIVDFLITVSGFVETVQFVGKVSSMTDFCDRLFRLTKPFPIIDVVKAVESQYSLAKRYRLLAFLLSHFSEERFIASLLQYCEVESFLGQLNDALDDPETVRSALTLVKTLLAFPQGREFLLPPISDARVDILSLIPPHWLAQSEGRYSLDAYAMDGVVKMEIYGIDVAINGRNPIVYRHLVQILKGFSAISIQVCLSLTEVIGTFLAISPDLINEDLADSARCIVESFNGIEAIGVPKLDSPDTPQLRVALFVEFAKEVHGTFIAAEQIASRKLMFAT
jgi:hypothetical protein